MLSFIKPTKLKLVLFLLVWITLWSSIKLDKVIRPIALELAYSKMNERIKETVASFLEENTEQVVTLHQKLDSSLDSEPKLVRKTAFLILITFLYQALPCYLCSCIIVFLTKYRRVAATEPCDVAT